MEQGNRMNNHGGGKPPKMPRFNMSWLYVIILISLIVVFLNGGGDALGGSANKKATYTEFKEYIEKGYVLSVTANKNDGNLKVYVAPNHIRDVYHTSAKNVGPAPYVEVQYGSIDEVDKYLDNMVKAKKIKSYNYVNEKGNDFISLLINFAPLIIFFLLIWWVSGRMGGGMGGSGGGIFNVGKSKARMYEKGNTLGITFKDVAGQEGAKQEVEEIVEFLKNPQKYTDLGGKIPKGALLVGPPGTGKTLLAKAVAGEAGVPFFSLSGSEFVEMFVGVGASRVRDLFQQAKAKAPCIVFIDEIDAIGRARSKSAAMGGNDERESTLNQLLTEMDGFGTNSGIIIMAATNRAEILDKALLRAGRFDRQIHVDLPDLNERKDIFMVHLRPLKIDETVEVAQLARQTPGFSGADIANVCNEAALIAARKNKEWVDKQCFLDAVDRIIGGLEKKTKLLTANEKRTIALHEAGHATISWFLEYANPLVKVTIVPRGQALGAAWYMPEERQISTKEEILDEICATLGGRAAEEICNGRISTGAMNDLEKVTKRAYGMIAYAGMGNKLPNLCFYNNQEYQFSKPYSEKTAETIDEEVRDLIAGEYARAKKVLTEHREGHEKLTQLLIDREVIFAEDLEEIFGPRPWVSRTDEILASNKEENEKSADKNPNNTDHEKENEEFIRQKIVQAVVEKAEKAEKAKQGDTLANNNPNNNQQNDSK